MNKGLILWEALGGKTVREQTKVFRRFFLGEAFIVCREKCRFQFTSLIKLLSHFLALAGIAYRRYLHGLLNKLKFHYHENLNENSNMKLILI